MSDFTLVLSVFVPFFAIIGGAVWYFWNGKSFTIKKYDDKDA